MPIKMKMQFTAKETGRTVEMQMEFDEEWGHYFYVVTKPPHEVVELFEGKSLDEDLSPEFNAQVLLEVAQTGPGEGYAVRGVLPSNETRVGDYAWRFVPENDEDQEFFEAYDKHGHGRE